MPAYTPWTAPDEPDGLRLDISGCAHLLGGEGALLRDLGKRLAATGFACSAAIAEVDDAVVIAPLEHATGLINSHLSVRYKLPLATVPAFLKTAAIGIAVYRIANTADRLTVEMRQRYDDHIRHLERV